MTPLFDEDGYEPSRLVGFAGNTLERRSEQRAGDCLAEALRHEGMLAYVAAGGKLLLKPNNDPLFAIGELEALRSNRAEAILLGYTHAGSPRLFVPADIAHDDPPAGIDAVGFRAVFAEGVLPPDQLGEFAQGASLLAWNTSSRFCGSCGAATRAEAGGYRRHCPSCKKAIFPRSDPAVIMLAVDVRRDRCLLGRSRHFRPGVYSCLAGFVEPGETIEAAVRRETQEEAGITLGRVKYHASQPWPFPHSLMIGCYGEALTGEISRDDSELEDCRWFARSEIEVLLKDEARHGLAPPYDGSIAYRLLEDWCQRA